MSKRKKEKAVDIPKVLSSPTVMEQIGWLEHSLLHAMSLGNHELYHSNVWAWLINRHSDFAAIFFPELKGKRVRATREEHHRDITIRADGNSTDLYVIENKFKSLPDLEQLEAYSKGVQKKERFRRGLVVGVGAPEWQSSNLKDISEGRWSFISFSSVIKRLASRRDLLANSEAVRFISSYCEATRASLHLLKILLNHYNRELPDPGQDWSKLHTVRLRDVFFKNSAQRFTQWLADENGYRQMKARFIRHGLDLSLSNGYSNGSWIVNVEIRNRKAVSDKLNHPWFGLQLQGRQFRRFATHFKRSSKTRKDKIVFEWTFNKFCQSGWFEKDPRTGWRKNELSFSQRESYDRFKPSFVYQYIHLTDFSWQGLEAVILHHLKKALRIQIQYNVLHQRKTRNGASGSL